MKNKYTKEQKDKVIELYKQTKCIKELSKNTGFPKTSIVRWLKNAGVYEPTLKHSLKYYDEIRTEVINKYLSGIDYHIIAKEYNINPGTIHLWCREKCVTRHRGTKSMVSNIHWFQNIDCEEKAYYLGFLFADGYVGDINKNHYDLRFSLQIKDKYILDKFANFIGMKNKSFIKNQKDSKGNYHKSYTIQFNCKEMILDLNKYGMVYLKENRKTFPKINKKLIRHFIRGYFDGDGCVDNDCIVSMCAYEKLSEEIQSVLQSYNFLCKIKTNHNINNIVLSATQKVQIYHFLYDDATQYIWKEKKKNLTNC